MDVIYDFYYIHGPMEPSYFCCFRCVIKQSALTVIKLLRFFVLIFAVFYQILFFCTTVAQSSKFHQNRGCFWSLHPTKPKRVVSSNDQYQVRKQFCSRCVAWTQVSSQSVPWRRKRSYSIFNIGNMMGCDHPSCVPVGPLAFRIFSNNDRQPFWIKKIIFDHVTNCCPNLLLYTKFHQNWFTRSASRRP